MHINSVSFGKAIKVFAPYETVQRVAQAANGKPTVSEGMGEQIRSIFDDTDKGHALVFALNTYADSSYILSGKESKEYLDMFFKHNLKENKIRKEQPKKADKLVREERLHFYYDVMKLISKTEEKFSLKIANDDKDVKKIFVITSNQNIKYNKKPGEK